MAGLEPPPRTDAGAPHRRPQRQRHGEDARGRAETEQQQRGRVVGHRRRRSARPTRAAKASSATAHDHVVEHRGEGGHGEAPLGVQHRGAEGGPAVEQHLRAGTARSSGTPTSSSSGSDRRWRTAAGRASIPPHGEDEQRDGRDGEHRRRRRRRRRPRSGRRRPARAWPTARRRAAARRRCSAWCWRGCRRRRGRPRRRRRSGRRPAPGR